jgi:hypothetical protein
MYILRLTRSKRIAVIVWNRTSSNPSPGKNGRGPVIAGARND